MSDFTEMVDAFVRKKMYKGYRLINHGYYPPDKCVWWQAENLSTGEADFHANTKRDLKAQIDEWLLKAAQSHK